MSTPTVPLYLLPASHPQARACAACTVRGDALFGALDESGLHRIHAEIASPSLMAGDRVYDRGQPSSAVFTVRSGIVRFERVTAGGARRIVRLAGRGDLIGQEALLQRPHADEAIACTDVQLCRIPHQMVDELGAAEPALLRELMQRWQRAVEAAETWAAELTAGPARRRVLQLLDQLEHWADDEGRIWLPRREDMGAMLDMTIETASRMVSALRREGVLQGDAGRDTRVDRIALQQALRALDDG
jgi:CRP/FNR family transcriptional regulator, anaerobic regulatory protein